MGEDTMGKPIILDKTHMLKAILTLALTLMIHHPHPHPHLQDLIPAHMLAPEGKPTAFQTK